MRKLLLILCVVFCSMFFSGCTNNQDTNRKNGLEDKSTSQQQQNQELQSSNESIKENSSVDIDLTKLSGTMIYAEVYNMMIDGDPYLGKSIKVKGTYYSSEVKDKVYHFALIEDAAACCSSGIEIMAMDDTIVFPKEGETIEVKGIYDAYGEEGFENYYLKISELQTDFSN